MHVRCMHFNGNTPFQYEDRWIVIDSVPQVVNADFASIGPNEWLIQTVPFTNVELSFLASRADETRWPPSWICPSASRCSRARRITWLEGEPVTFAKMYFAAGYRMTTQF